MYAIYFLKNCSGKLREIKKKGKAIIIQLLLRKLKLKRNFLETAVIR